LTIEQLKSYLITDIPAKYCKTVHSSGDDELKEITGNIWDYIDSAIIAITTNGSVSRSGKAVIGRGVAADAVRYYPDIPFTLGSLIARAGNHVFYLGNGIVSFPVEHSPYETPDLRLIKQSAVEIVQLADTHQWNMIIIPRPGCGGGGLSWNEVRPALADLLDNRFNIISPPAE
jgi:hypothetical protein